MFVDEVGFFETVIDIVKWSYFPSLLLKLAFEHAHKLFYIFGKKLIICIHYNLKLLKFSITNKHKGVMSIVHLQMK